MLRSNKPGMAAQAFMRIRRTARPIVAFERLPGPNRLLRELTPSSRATGPFTITMMPEPPRLDDGPTRLNFGSSIASAAAKTTGMYSGRHPAITAFAATFSTLISRRRSGSSPTISSADLPPQSMNCATLRSVGGTTGRPSVQPRRYICSIASIGSSHSIPIPPVSMLICASLYIQWAVIVLSVIRLASISVHHRVGGSQCELDTRVWLT